MPLAAGPRRDLARAPPILGRVIGTDPVPGFHGVGQRVAETVVRRAAEDDRLHRTLLVHGPPGAGKGAFVEDLLALLFCTDADPARRPCNACRGCREGRARAHPDLVIGSPEIWREGRSTGESIVSSARRWLLESAGAPIAAAQRVVLVEEVDRANEQAQNALLKVLEEPAPRQMFVLVADEVDRLLPTIRSRSLPLRIGPVPRADLVALLIDRERLPSDQAEALARTAEGMAGRAIGLARDPSIVAWRRQTQAELLSLLERGRADRFASVGDLLAEAGRRAPRIADDPGPGDDEEPRRTSSAEQRQAALLVVEAWSGLARDLLVTAAGRPDLAAGGHLLDGLPAAAARLDLLALRRFLELLERIREGLRQNAAPRLALQVAMLAWPSHPPGQ